jgi:hypothetical protein
MPSAAQVMMSKVGQIEEDIVEASLEVMVVKQWSTSASLIPSATGEVVPMEASR